MNSLQKNCSLESLHQHCIQNCNHFCVSSISLTQEIYTLIGDYLIVELIIPNAQRPGIIQGVTIDEAIRVKHDIICESYHRLMVSSHKTGYVQSGTIFIYKEV